MKRFVSLVDGVLRITAHKCFSGGFGREIPPVVLYGLAKKRVKDFSNRKRLAKATLPGSKALEKIFSNSIRLGAFSHSRMLGNDRSCFSRAYS